MKQALITILGIASIPLFICVGIPLIFLVHFTLVCYALGVYILHVISGLLRKKAPEALVPTTDSDDDSQPRPTAYKLRIPPVGW